MKDKKSFSLSQVDLTEHHNNEKFTKTLERADELVYQAKKDRSKQKS